MRFTAQFASFSVLAATFGLVALLQGCDASGEEDPDFALPLSSSGHALSSNGYGADGPTTASTDGAATEVWKVTADWSDTTTTAAKRSGMAWGTNSGLNWDEKYNLWVESMVRIPKAGGYGETFQVTTPYGKTLPVGSLECAELGMTLRVLFSSWYGLPFMLEARDSNGARIFAGHFGFRTKTGRYRNTQNFRTRYEDYTGLSASDIQNNWPSDSNLRGKHLYGGGSDANPFLDGEAGAGHYFDELLLNKRVGHFLTVLLPFFGSVNLADDANLYHVTADSVRAGDILLKRWQRRGIGHVMVVKHVESIGGENLSAEIVSGSMPRRQGDWESPTSTKMAFTSDYTGGEGEAHDGNNYVDLGGGLKRYLAPRRNGNHWQNRVLTSDRDNYLRWSDKTGRAARPARFGVILGEPDPEVLRDAILDVIEAKREHLRNYPASCSARTAREQAWEQLYEVMQDKFNMSRDAVDEEYRILDDYVFAELEYNESKTCCWNSTTRDMYDVIMDYANKEAQNESCSSPTVFKAEDGDYRRWADHAGELGNGGAWVAWSPDESCPQATPTLTDTEKAAGWTPWCEITEPGDDHTTGPDPYEPNNSRGQAFTLNPGTFTGAQITGGGDEDWFTFEPPTGSTVRFAIDFNHGEGDLEVKMFAGERQVDSATSSNDGEVVDTVYDGTDPLYVQVFGYSGATNEYTITVTFEGGESTGPACSTTDDTQETAVELGAGTYHGLAICGNDAVDWIRIPATTGSGTVRIEFNHSSGDLDMTLYKSNGSVIGSSTGSGNSEELDLPPGLRFLKVFGYSGATNEYTLIIED
ncbi:MAG: hypothetical protein GY898_31060 [Proteobacteria bacterium]|nr:hypothetical protein [Pseudomonadota bacterium]